MKINSLFYLLFFCFGFEAMALDCPKGRDLKSIALDMIKAELSGIRFNDSSKNRCLNQKNFPYLLIESDPSNENAPKISGYLDNINDVKILNIQKIDPELESYKVDYQFKVQKNKKKAFESESLTFFLYKDKPNHKIYGCGGILQYPKSYFLFKDCPL